MIRLPVNQLEKGKRLLESEEIHYLTRVLRLKVGAKIELFDKRSNAFATGVLAFDGAYTLFVDEVHRTPIEQCLMLFQGLPKGDKFADITRDATELGATHIVATRCERSVSMISSEKSLEKQARWQTIAEQAARQSGRVHVPQVSYVSSWEEGLQWAQASKATLFVFYEKATVPMGKQLLAALQRDATQSIAWFVGPEGGLSDNEVSKAERAGAQIVSIGPTILRTETVATAIFGAFHAIRSL